MSELGFSKCDHNLNVNGTDDRKTKSPLDGNSSTLKRAHSPESQNNCDTAIPHSSSEHDVHVGFAPPPAVIILKMISRGGAVLGETSDGNELSPPASPLPSRPAQRVTPSEIEMRSIPTVGGMISAKEAHEKPAPGTPITKRDLVESCALDSTSKSIGKSRPSLQSHRQGKECMGVSVEEKTTAAAAVVEERTRRISFRLPIGPSPSSNDINSAYFTDPLMHAVDFLEDEIDGHTYDDIVPLSVRLALEEQVFGWSHLFSDIAGHIVYTAGWALFTFWMFTWLSLGREEGGPSLFRNRRQPFYEPRFGLSFSTFNLARNVLTLLSAISAFRTVRRRKRVWLRAPYGSAEYKSDGRRRRRSVDETDRVTVLGRIGQGARGVGAKVGSRVRYLREVRAANKVLKKLKRAQLRFERRHKNGRSSGRRMSLLRQDLHDVANSHHNRVRILSETGKTEVMSRATNRVRRRRPRLSARGNDKRSRVIYHRDDSAKENRNLSTQNEFKSSKCHKGVPSHTMPSYSVPQSILRDQISLSSGPIHNIPYAHGGFFGAAPFMLADPLWVDILRSLMPDVYVEISRRVLSAPVPKLIHWAENNPVVAAYGTAHEMKFSGKIISLEWDVFLDPHLVRRLEVVLEERSRFLRRCRSASGWSGWNDNQSHVYEEVTPPFASDSDRAVLHYYNTEIKERTSVLVDRMLIAHGNLTQLMLEQTGFGKHYNFSRVKRTRRTLGGGIFARQWLAVYAQALKMGMGFVKKEDLADTSEFEDDTDVSFSGSSVPTTPTGLSSESEEEERECPEDVSPILVGNDSKMISISNCNSVQSHHQINGCDRGNRTQAYPTKDDDICAAIDVRSYEQNKNVCADLLPFASPCKNPLKISTGSSNRSSIFSDIVSHSNAKIEKKTKKLLGCYQEGDYHYCDGSCCKESVATAVPGDYSCHIRGNNVMHTRFSPQNQCSKSISDSHQSFCFKQPTNLSDMTLFSCPNTSIVESISLLKEITDCMAPLGLVLDMKSRHVSHHVWALVIDALRDVGSRVEGIASFTCEEIRDISRFCASPVKEMYFFHSAGDLQQACHSGRIKMGDSLFFNAGSLLWDRVNMKNLWDVLEALRTRCWDTFDVTKAKGQYSLMPYSEIMHGPKEHTKLQQQEERGAEWSSTNGSFDSTGDATNTSYADDNLSDSSDLYRPMLSNKVQAQPRRSSTIQDYKDFYCLSIGLYLQEFAVDDAAVNFIVRHVNANPHVYDLGLSWGGVNGITVRGIQPGRFTNTDGFWNQRYAGQTWDGSVFPC